MPAESPITSHGQGHGGRLAVAAGNVLHWHVAKRGPVAIPAPLAAHATLPVAPRPHNDRSRDHDRWGYRVGRYHRSGDYNCRRCRVGGYHDHAGSSIPGTIVPAVDVRVIVPMMVVPSMGQCLVGPECEDRHSEHEPSQSAAWAPWASGSAPANTVTGRPLANRPRQRARRTSVRMPVRVRQSASEVSGRTIYRSSGR